MFISWFYSSKERNLLLASEEFNDVIAYKMTDTFRHTFYEFSLGNNFKRFLVVLNFSRALRIGYISFSIEVALKKLYIRKFLSSTRQESR